MDRQFSVVQNSLKVSHNPHDSLGRRTGRKNFKRFNSATYRVGLTDSEIEALSLAAKEDGVVRVVGIFGGLKSLSLDAINLWLLHGTVAKS